ncbi:site-specific integrase [bacterium]|nr:site-specific integrase [bacterium]
MNSWTIDQSKVLTRSEIRTVLLDLKRRAKRSANTRMNLTIFRLACCCGLRVGEICRIRLRDVHLGVKHPHIYLPKGITKTKKPRRVPLWWDLGTQSDLASWREERVRQGATADNPFVCAQSHSAFGRPLTRVNARNRFISSLRVLGPERQRELTIHSGRHSFVSHALTARSPQEVRDAAGHASLSTTSLYAHVLVEEHEEAGDLFEF